MEDREKSSESVWMATVDGRSKSALSSDVAADVCVVGAGIAGLTTAYQLAREGMVVIVLDADRIGGGETERTTAHLSNALDDRYYELERLHGSDATRLTAESHTAAISRIEEIVAQENIDCDFERLNGYLFAATPDDEDVIDRELEAAHRAGLVEVLRLERPPINAVGARPCLQFPRQAQFNPLKYLIGLSAAIERNAGRIFTNTQAVKIEGGIPARVFTKGGPIVTARELVVATNTPVNDIVAVHTKQAAYRTYVIAVRVPHGSINKALYWDTARPYHYIRLQAARATTVAERYADYDLLIVGGEDHKSGQADDPCDRYDRLERWTRDLFQTTSEVEYQWSGQVMETIDGLAFIGHNPVDQPNVYIATGDSGMGMTHSTIAGMLLTDLIMGRENPWAELYDPSRKPVAAASRFAQENLNVLAQYAELFTKGQVNDPEEIPLGCGSILRRGMSKIAVYRDAEGALHERSAICTHLGCVVAWNSAESTWDCPCHGSRFDRYGAVIHGPAVKDLQKAEEPRVDRTAKRAGT